MTERYNPLFRAQLVGIIRLEGGYKLHKVKYDTGGLTYAGITQRWHPDWPGWKYAQIAADETDDVENRGNAQAVAREMVAEFYCREYWQPLRIMEIQSNMSAFALFSSAVNMGKVRAVRMAQRAAGVTVDGIIGPATVEAINNSVDFVPKFQPAKIARYTDIVYANREQEKFLLGWNGRVFREYQEAKKLDGISG